MLDIKNFLPGADEKINQLLRFAAEVDKMTAISRRTLLIDKSRRENDAEHSWHIALMAMLFKDYAPEGCHVTRAVKMFRLFARKSLRCCGSFCACSASFMMSAGRMVTP